MPRKVNKDFANLNFTLICDRSPNAKYKHKALCNVCQVQLKNTAANRLKIHRKVCKNYIWIENDKKHKRTRRNTDDEICSTHSDSEDINCEVFDTEKFIVEIEERPTLYDKKVEEYSNKNERMKCWVEVAKAMHASFEETSDSEKKEIIKDLATKWKSLRDNFKRQFRKNETSFAESDNKKKKYAYYDQLKFLIPIITQNSDRDSLTNIHVTEEVYDLELPTDETEITNNACRQKLSSRMEDQTSSFILDFQQNINEDKYGHKSFLLSFYPILKNMSISNAMQLRTAISEVVSSHVCHAEGIEEWEPTIPELIETT